MTADAGGARILHQAPNVIYKLCDTLRDGCTWVLTPGIR